MADPHILQIGPMLRRAREARGLDLQEVAAHLHWPPALLEALEREDWDRIPPGQERPMVRQIADYLGCDLEAQAEAMTSVPGELEEAPPDPVRQRWERGATLVLGLALLAALVWLFTPGASLKGLIQQPVRGAGGSRLVGEAPKQPFQVLGEALPEAPETPEGFLVMLRVTDLCHVTVTHPGGTLQQELRPGTPWQCRVKGPFTIDLDNAGLALLQVAGRAIVHGRGVGETWKGSFDEKATWLRPVLPGTPADVEPEPPEPDPNEET